jgi:hypothetical protein
MRRAPIPALLVALAVAACGSAQTSSSSSSSPQAHAARTTSRCAKLTTSYLGTQGATGHLEVTFALRNVSHESCRVQGYPSARLLDGAGRTLPMRVRRGRGFFPDTMRPARAITLAPGGRARFGVSFVTNNEFAGAHTCRTAASAVAVMPGWRGAPPRPVSLRRAPRISPCGNQLVVSPLYA